jgi:glucose-6-phosphate 1-epimerase
VTKEISPRADTASTVGVSVTYSERGPGITVLTVASPLASASVSLFGGQVLAWQPAQTAFPVLWLANAAIFDGRSAIRGGVPICWPWFGPHPVSPGQNPAHGLARIQPWHLDKVSFLPDGTVELTLTISRTVPVDGDLTTLSLTQTIQIGTSLDIALSTSNVGSEPTRYSEGLHTYFQVSDVGTVEVGGLEGRIYVDLTAGNQRQTQQGAIRFDGELGRLFLDTADVCVIDDPGFDRRIRVEKTGSLSTAVWNPAERTATTMRDLGPLDWRTMACVETANALENTLTLDPGQTRTMSARYVVESRH